MLQCPTGFVFNSNLNVCQRGTLPCTKIDCSKASVSKPYIVYASNKQFYAYCVFNAGNIRTLMFRCGDNEIFDTTINACRLSCKAKGYFQNPADCNGYYYCSSSTAIPSAIMNCPPNYVFDGSGCNKDPATCKFPPPAADAA